MKYLNSETVQKLLKGMSVLKVTYTKGLMKAKKEFFRKDDMIAQLKVQVEELKAANADLIKENDRVADEAAMAFSLLDDLQQAESQTGQFLKNLAEVLQPTEEELLASIIITDDVGEA